MAKAIPFIPPQGNATSTGVQSAGAAAPPMPLPDANAVQLNAIVTDLQNALTRLGAAASPGLLRQYATLIEEAVDIDKRIGRVEGALGVEGDLAKFQEQAALWIGAVEGAVGAPPASVAAVTTVSTSVQPPVVGPWVVPVGAGTAGPAAAISPTTKRWGWWLLGAAAVAGIGWWVLAGGAQRGGRRGPLPAP